MQSKLTPKQQRFADEYLVDLNAKAAYKRAGYAADGNSAEVSASKLLRVPKVAEYIQTAMDRRSERAEITSERVLAEIAKLAFADIRKVFNENGQLLPVHELPDEIAASVSSIEVVASRVPGGEPTDIEHTAKIKFWDKRGSLELLGKHMKLFTEKVESQNTNHNINQDAVDIDMSKLSGSELESLTALLKKAAK